MLPYKLVPFCLSLLGLAKVVAGVPPAWAGWPECAFTCADGLGCKVPEDRCVCVHNTFLACVTFALCGSDDADLTRDKWDALCTVEPPGPPSSTSVPSSTSPTSTSSTSTSPTSTPIHTTTSTHLTSSKSTPISTSATPRTSASSSSPQPTTNSITGSQRSSSSQPSVTAFISFSPPAVSTPTPSNDSAGVGASPDGTQNAIELERKKANTGAIVGGILGGLAGLGLLLALLVYRRRLEKKKEKVNARTVAQPILQDDQYPSEKESHAYDASSNPERPVAYEKGNTRERPQEGSPMGSNTSPVNQISPFDAQPTPTNTLANPKAQIMDGTNSSESLAISPFNLIPAVTTRPEKVDDIHGGLANVPSGSQEGAQPNVYIPRSSMEKGPDPFGDPSSANAAQVVTSSSVSGLDASPPTASHSTGDEAVDSSPLDAYTADSAAGPSGPTMVYAMDSEVQPPPYIRP